MGRLRAGSSYVVFGKNVTWSASIELSSLNGSNGFKLNGESKCDQSGSSVSGAGDVNGDGITRFSDRENFSWHAQVWRWRRSR